MEHTLDPADWTAFRALAHRMVDDTLDHLASLRDQPAWRPMPEEVRTALSGPLAEPQGATAAYEDFLTYVRPYPNGNLGPRFWGWVQGNGTPLAMMADMLASALNPHMAGFNQAPALVELQVLEWLAELMQMPKGTSGILTSGGTVANLIGLAVARHAKAGFDVRELGLQGHAQPLLTVYCSTEAHGWARRAVELLGLGNAALRRIRVDGDFRMNVDELRDAVARDRRDGHRPICVIASAGTVNTGAIDDLPAIADLCREEDVWFHVDGAFGALAMLSPNLRSRVAGVERADSLAFDLHKWGYLPFEVGCALVRDAEAHRAAFELKGSYISALDRGVIAGGLPLAERGLELTRGFKALKVWLSLKAHGAEAIATLIDQNVAQAEYLARRIKAEENLELAAPLALNIVCFRHRGSDALNREILMRLQEEGVAVPSGTTIDGRFALRVAITNHRSRLEDFDVLVDAVKRIGAQ
ncbi:MAG TPA: aminotransferase class V-fold PLP-dependent enzyme [Thermoanaerobaculia bacterium]